MIYIQLYKLGNLIYSYIEDDYTVHVHVKMKQ